MSILVLIQNSTWLVTSSITKIQDIKGLANVDKWWFYLTHRLNKRDGT